MPRVNAQPARVSGRIAPLLTLGVLFVMTVVPSAEAGDLSTAIKLSIPAQALESALRSLANQADIQIMFSSRDVAGIAAPPISGEISPRDALSLMLRSTSLEYRVEGRDTVVVRHKKATAITQRKPVANAGNAATAPPVALQEIVVTAQKREETLQNVPISISVLRGAELDSSTAQGVTDVLNSVPGVATQENYLGGGTVIVMRGVSSSFPAANGSSPVAYYLDSVPVGLIRSALEPDLDVFDLSRVEVLRGPQGTLYGASALNGVVRVLTNDADLEEFDLKARVLDSGTQYGGDNYQGDLAVNVPVIPGMLAVRAVAGYESDSGWIDQVNKNDVNSSELKNYRVKVDAKPTSDLSIGLSAWSSRENAAAPSIGYAFDKSSAELPQPLYTNFDAYALKVAYQFQTFSVSSATSYFDYSNGGSLDLLPFGLPGSIFFSGITSNVFSEEVNFTSSLSDPWRWSAGGIYRRGTEDNLQTFSAIDEVPPELVDLTSKSYAVYGELTRLLLGGRLELTAGLRHFHDDISQEGQIGADTPFLPASSIAEANTPRGVATWHETDNLMFYASYSQGFRSGFPQDPTVPAGFSPVRPDRLRNYEIGSKGSSGDGLLAYDASIYYMQWQGIQQSLTVPYEDVTTTAIVNGKSASGVGTDLGVTLRPLPDLTLQANVSWNDLEFDSDVISGGLILFQKGDRTTSSPETTAGLAGQYAFSLGAPGYREMISASANYTSSQAYRGFVGPTLSELEVDDGDPIVLSRVSFTVQSPYHWSASLYGDNLNNERGAPVKAFVGVPSWDARIRPRTIGLQLDYDLR